jgi:hypothetical protein
MSTLSTASPLQIAPPAASGVSVTPNGSAWGNSAWVEVTHATSVAWALAGVVIDATADRENDIEFEVDVGIGASGSETVVTTLHGVHGQSLGSSPTFSQWLGVPVDSVPAATRVAVRLRKDGTDAHSWTIAVVYYAHPILGTIVTTGLPQLVTPSATNGILVTSPLPNAAWANTAWFTVFTTAAASTLAAVSATWHRLGSAFYELDIGVGAPGSEVVLTTLRSGDGIGNSTQVVPLWPLLRVGAATRVSVRMRCDAAIDAFSGNALFGVKLAYYAGTIDPLITTAAAQVIVPAAQDATVVTAAGVPAPAFTSGAWVPFIASATAWALVGLVTGNGSNYEREVDIGFGALGAEVVATTFRFSSVGAWITTPFVPLKPALVIPVGTRVSARLRSSTIGEGDGLALVCLPSADVQQVVSVPQLVWPGPSSQTGVAVTANPTPWANSTWSTLTPAAVANYQLTGITYVFKAGSPSAQEAEIEIGTGPIGAETVLTTVRVTIVADPYISGTGYFSLPYPTAIPSGARVAVRLRTADTGGLVWTMAVTYIGVSVAPALPPVVVTVMPANTAWRIHRIDTKPRGEQTA